MIQLAKIGCLFLICTSLNAQISFKKDSLQVKVYTNLKIKSDLSLDTITVQKIFCEYCSEQQLESLKKKSKYLTYKMLGNKTYQVEGTHLVALNLRVSRKEFDNLKTENKRQ